VSIGDVNSNERGSGARYNDGKLDLTLLPPVCWGLIGDSQFLGMEEFGYRSELEQLIRFWEGDTDEIYSLMDCLEAEELMGAARVFAYGAKKYAPWNWAKGMPWSVPMGCYLRHMLTAHPHEPDPESGLSHRDHAVCNLVMLAHFATLCRDMDDRPEEIRPEFHGAPTQKQTWQEIMAADDLSPSEVRSRLDRMMDEAFGQGLWSEFRVTYLDSDLSERTERMVDMPTSILNELVEQAVEEQEFRERTLRATGQLYGESA
jgi:hypothetical protein